MKGLQKVFTRMIVGAIYGGLMGYGITFLLGGSACVLIFALAGMIFFGSSGFGILISVLKGSPPQASYLSLLWVMSLIGSLGISFILALAEALVEILAFLVDKLAQSKSTTPEVLIDEHVEWLLDLPHLIRYLYSRSTINTKKSQNKQKASEVGVIEFINQGLSEVFPEEWDEWQHWISDIMESRTRMQSKGMNHRLVSLITFYRLTRFAFHIGIDKVYILATRRATR